jgi:hypothetical protein
MPLAKLRLDGPHDPICVIADVKSSRETRNFSPASEEAAGHGVCGTFYRCIKVELADARSQDIEVAGQGLIGGVSPEQFDMANRRRRSSLH